MANTTKLSGEVRTQFGKGFARRERMANRVPAVLYGHGTDPVHLSLPGHELMLATKASNALLEIAFDGKSEMALVKDIQRHPVRRTLTHIDLLLVRRGEKVQVDVSVIITGEPEAPAVATVDALTLSVEAEATNIPESIEVDVEGKEDGTVIHASELSLPSGVELISDPETVVVGVAIPRVEEEPEEETEEGEEGEEGAEGEESEESSEDDDK